MNKTLEAIVCTGMLATGCRDPQGNVRWVDINYIEITNQNGYSCSPEWDGKQLCVLGDSINIIIGVKYTTDTTELAPIDEINKVLLKEYKGDRDLTLELEESFRLDYNSTINNDSYYLYEGVWKPNESNTPPCLDEDTAQFGSYALEFGYILTSLIEYTFSVDKDFSVTTQKEIRLTENLWIYEHNCFE